MARKKHSPTLNKVHAVQQLINKEVLPDEKAYPSRVVPPAETVARSVRQKAFLLPRKRKRSLSGRVAPMSLPVSASRREQTNRTRGTKTFDRVGHLNCRRKHKTFTALSKMFGGSGKGRRMKNRPNRSRRQYC